MTVKSRFPRVDWSLSPSCSRRAVKMPLASSARGATPSGADNGSPLHCWPFCAGLPSAFSSLPASLPQLMRDQPAHPNLSQHSFVWRTLLIASDFHRFVLPTCAYSIEAGRLCVDQEGKQARNEFRARVRRGLRAAPTRAAKSTHPTTHPEFVPMVSSSTDLV